jgi:cobalt-zinc-cadmium efflux system outer membrane protein
MGMFERYSFHIMLSFMRAFILVAVVTLIAAWQPQYCQAAETTNDDAATLEMLIKDALKGNQQLIAAAAQAQRYNIRIPLVDNLSDPLLAFYYLDFPIANISSGYTAPENEEKFGPPTMVDIEAVRGKILTGRDMVENQALWYDYVSADLILQVTGQVREGFYRLYFLDKIIAVTEQSLITLDSLIEASSASYVVGKVRQKDVLRAHTERYQLQAELIRLRQQRIATESELNYLAAQPIGKPLAPKIKSQLTHESLPEMRLSTVDFISGLYRNRPLGKGYQSLGGRFKAMRGMVQMYFNREVQTEAMFEADSGYRSIKATGADFYSSTVADLQATVANLEKNRELANLYGRVIVPHGHQSYVAGLADFKVGQENFLTLLKTLIDYNKDQALYYQALADYMVDMARLEKLSGVALN